VFNFSNISIKPHLSTSYSIGSNAISKVSTLGIVISSDLNWESHHNYIFYKAYKMLGPTEMFLLKKYYHSVKKNNSINLLLDPSYCFVLFCRNLIYLLKDIVSLKHLQRRATKYILNDYTSDYKYRLTTLKILPFMYFLT